MNSKVHSVIMKSAINLCGTSLVDELNQEIDLDRWEDYLENTLGFDMRDDKEYKKNHVPKFHFRTYADLLVYGAFMEDQTFFKSDVDDSHLTNGFFRLLIDIAGEGEYLHWLEHYWGDELELGRGLRLTADYVCQVLTEANGADSLLGEYFGKLSEIMWEMIVKPLSIFFGNSFTYEAFRAAPDRAQDYWKILIDQYNKGEKEAAFFNLGKVCHLLEDMCTPAHVHGDCHLGAKWIAYAIKKYLNLDLTWLFEDQIDDDQYERYTGDLIEGKIPLKKVDKGEPEAWLDNLEDALPERWRLTNENGFPTYNTEWELLDYFYHAARITKKYDSDDCDGSGSGHPYRWLHFNPLSTASWDLERRWDGDLTDYACDQMAAHLIPLAIADTAGLLYKFCDTVGLPCSNDLIHMNFQVLNFTVVNDEDDCDSGEIYLSAWINDRTHYSSGKISADSGDFFYYLRDSRIEKLKDSFLVHDLSTDKLEVWSEAYDNDDWDIGDWKIHEASDDLGYTHKNYNISELPAHYYEYDVESRNGDYKISYELVKKARETEQMEWLYENSHFEEGKSLLSNPILLNLTTMQRHCSVNSTGRPCGTWNRASNDLSVAFYMTEEELFKVEEPIDVVKNLRKLEKSLEEFEKNKDKISFPRPSRRVENGRNGRKVSALEHVSSKNFDVDVDDLPKLVDKIEKSKEKCVIAARENSPYKKFIRFKASNDKQFKAWSRVTSNNIHKRFNFKCSCCKKGYLIFLKNKQMRRYYIEQRKDWFPKKTSSEIRWNKKTSFEKMRGKIYYKSTKTKQNGTTLSLMGGFNSKQK